METLDNNLTDSSPVALGNIDRDEQLFSIPNTAVLNVQNSDLYQHLSKDIDTLDPWLGLVLTMVYESGKAERSKWYPYVKILPTTFNTLVYWSPAELAELQGSSVVSKIGKLDADEVFVEVLLPLAMKHAELFGQYAPALKGSDATTVFLDIAHGMATLVMAYAFDLEREEREEDVDEDGFLEDYGEHLPQGMVPLADMINADGARNNL